MIESWIINQLFQDLTDPFLITALVLIAIHFGTPLAYYWHAKTRWLPKPWNIRVNENYRPKVTVIIPTYNEAEFIQSKLDNIYDQDYPKSLLEVIVVDSASIDGTTELVKEWSSKHKDINLELIKEPIRRGMVPALNYALKHIARDNEIVIFTDADAFWEPATLKKVVKYFADLSVGAVTTCIIPLGEDGDAIEGKYRNYYNVVRVAESKIHSTPVHNGVFIAYRKKLLDMIGGLPTYTGNNDSTPASLIAFAGYRAIQLDDAIAKEPLRSDQTKRKIRRAQHLVLHFIHTKRYAKKLRIYRKTLFDMIWNIEAYLHLANPWLLPVGSVLFVLSTFQGSLSAAFLLTLGLVLLVLRIYRTWVLQQVYLVIASLRTIWTKEIAWQH